MATLAALAYFPGVFFVLMRFGLLPGAIAVFVEQALVGYGAWTALGGVPILGDPLGDARLAQGLSPARRGQD